MSDSLKLAAVLLMVINIESYEHFHQRFNAESWLKEYAFSNVTLKSFPKELRQNFDNILEFSFKSDDFEIGLLKDSPVGNSTVISIDGKVYDTKEITKEINIYRGAGYQGEHYTQYTVLVTKYGIDGIIRLNQDTFIIEPSQSDSRPYHGNSRPKEYQSSGMDSLTIVFPSIIYQPEDIIENNTVSWGISKDEVFSWTSKKSPLRKKRDVHTQHADCTLHIVADHTFFNLAGHSDIVTTISEMMYFVTEANTIFRSTDFDGDGAGDNVGFYVSHVTLYTGTENYKMSDTSLSAYKYLDAFSEHDFDNFCMGVAFSCRDFDGILGVAWVANSNAYASGGGICQKRELYSKKPLNLNTNFVTLFSRGQRMPSYKSALTLTHEFGHSFGSPHDKASDDICVPKNSFGKYIMYPYAVDGSKPNHNQFSSCSISYMFPVIKNKGICFTSTVGICGNGIRDKNEECDCGTIDTCELLDPCCTPSDVASGFPDLPCTIRRSEGKLCSRTSPCCTSACTYSRSDEICRLGGECVIPTYCNGTSGDCPEVRFEPKEKLCDSGRKTCQSGKCIGSICSLLNRTECECQSEAYECHLCCLWQDVLCIPASLGEGYITKHVGAACRNAQGFCDEEAKCVLQDPDSVINRMNQLFSVSNISEFSFWMRTHWYYIVAAIAGLLFVTAIFIATCRQRMDVHTTAFMYGQFIKIKREAEIQKHYIENRQKVVRAKFESDVQKIKDGSKTMSLSKAVARLKMFFPTVPNSELVKISKLSTKEEMAVTLLLMKGYPFQNLAGPINTAKES